MCITINKCVCTYYIYRYIDVERRCGGGEGRGRGQRLISHAGGAQAITEAEKSCSVCRLPAGGPEQQGGLWFGPNPKAWEPGVPNSEDRRRGLSQLE